MARPFRTLLASLLPLLVLLAVALGAGRPSSAIGAGGPTLGTCEPCQSVPDTCCAKVPVYVVEAPTFSNHVLVTTRERVMGWDSVVTVHDLTSPYPTPLEDENWALISRFSGPTGEWNVDSLGSVFGVTVDKFGNIFVTHTSCYNNDNLGQVFKGGPGAIYRLDGLTGKITTFCVLPQSPDPNYTSPDHWPGLGNITYDCRHDQFFVTNMENGFIYRIKASGLNAPTGTAVDSLDPMAPDNGLPGWAPLGERLWGVQIHGDRVFYGNWAEDFTTFSPTVFAEIRSVGLNGAGNFIPISDQHELWMPNYLTMDLSMPVSDISFSAGGKMLVAERSMQNESYPWAHQSRVLEYQCVGGCWTPANSYAVGTPTPENAAGGVDYDRYAFGGGSIGRVWASGDHLHAGSPYPDVIYGFQGFRPPGGTILTSMLFDSDTNILFGDKTSIGDIECLGCPTGGAICGRKFHDANHNGVFDSGDTPLPGWSIQLSGPGGPYFASTDGLGLYCFYDLPAGNFTVSEVGQPNWVQTAPAGGTFALSLAANQAVTGLEFGNYQCTGAGATCTTPPPNMAAWWPFDDPLSSTTAADVTHLSPPRNVAQLFGAAAITAGGHVRRMLCIPGELDYAKVPNSNQLGLSFGAGSFGMDCWVRMNPGGGSPRMVVEKRVLLSTSGYKTRGWALYLNGLQATLEIGNGLATQILPGPTVTASTWEHLAVTVDRTTAQGRWYLNGAVVSTFNFVPTPGTVSSNADLYMGAPSPPFGAGASFDGCIDDLEIFYTPSGNPLPAASVLAIYNAGIRGKCPDLIRMPEVTTICQSQTSVSMCFTICNTTNSTKSYHWSLAGLPAGPGCTVPGPLTFTPPAGSITLVAGACSTPICVTIPRPAGLTAQNATSCYQLTVVNDSTNVCLSQPGKIRADNTCWCLTPASTGVVSVSAHVLPGTLGTPVIWDGANPCGGGTALPWRVIAHYEPTDHEDPMGISLNGLPPGEPVFGELSVGPDGNGTIEVAVSAPNGYDMAKLYEIKLEADMDGDGQYEPVNSIPIRLTYDEEGTTEVEPAIEYADAVRLVTQPNPFFRGATVTFSLARAEDATLAVYDISGRLVRQLHRGRLTPGPQRFEWNGRDGRGKQAPAGVYFLRLDGDRLHLDTKLVKLR